MLKKTKETNTHTDINDSVFCVSLGGSDGAVLEAIVNDLLDGFGGLDWMPGQARYMYAQLRRLAHFQIVRAFFFGGGMMMFDDFDFHEEKDTLLDLHHHAHVILPSSYEKFKTIKQMIRILSEAK